MYFNSPVFLIFVLMLFPVYFLLKNKNIRTVFLSLSCLVFYGVFNIYYVPLIVLISLIYFYFAIRISAALNLKRKKLILVSVISFNLLILFLFKYLNFFTGTLNGIFSINIPGIEIILPAGISFYTFLNISYLVEVYRETIQPENNFIRYFTFSSFWPSVMSGPILRAKDFLVQFNKNRTISWEIFYNAFLIISFGFFKKVFIADNLAYYANRVYDSGIPVTFLNSWAAAYAYTLQIYFDFSGYTDIAIGFALLLGFRIPDNFNFPYASYSFTEFWKRWHITLSMFIRDYLFLPFSYSALRRIKSQYAAYIFAALASMFLAGLWHGASWNFVLWGVFHGAALSVERGIKLLRKRKKPVLNPFIKKIIFFHFLVLSWVLFRNELPKAFSLFSVMSGLTSPESIDVFGSSVMIIIAFVTVLVLLIQKYLHDKDLTEIFYKQKYLKFKYAAALIIIWIIIFAAGGKGEAFIYFKF